MRIIQCARFGVDGSRSQISVDNAGIAYQHLFTGVLVNLVEIAVIVKGIDGAVVVDSDTAQHIGLAYRGAGHGRKIGISENEPVALVIVKTAVGIAGHWVGGHVGGHHAYFRVDHVDRFPCLGIISCNAGECKKSIIEIFHCIIQSVNLGTTAVGMDIGLYHFKSLSLGLRHGIHSIGSLVAPVVGIHDTCVQCYRGGGHIAFGRVVAQFKEIQFWRGSKGAMKKAPVGFLGRHHLDLGL